MKNQIRLLFFALAMFFSVTSCLEEKPLENDPPTGAQSLLNMQRAFISATNGASPMMMGKDEFAVYRISARLYTGQFQGLGFRSAQVIEAANGNTIAQDGNGIEFDLKTRNLKIVLTDYKEPTTPEEEQNPVIELQKEWKCTFLKPPYYLWWDDSICPLPPEQNYWVFAPIEEPTTPIFFNLKTTKGKQKLPQKLIDENRCYGFENCEINVVQLEYDMYGIVDGVEKRIHYVNTFTPDLPYLSSNIKTCYSTLLTVGDNKHPGEICQELIDLIPGETAPEYCPDNNEGPCVESKFNP